MKILKLINKIVILILLSGLCSSCINLSKNYPIRSQYMLDVHYPPRVQKKLSTDILEVYPTSISPQFAGNSFVYLTSNINYMSDYYNAFFIPPAQQFTQIITRYFDHTALFYKATTGNNFLKNNYILQTNVLALYADYRSSFHPKGALVIEFILFKVGEENTTLLLDKTYKQSVPLAQKDSQSLIVAWNQGLQNILKQFQRDLTGLLND